MVQHRILKTLLESVPIPDYVYAFEKGKSIPKMTEKHVGKGLVISLDLKDFFTSIKQYHLNQAFIHLGMGPRPAWTLSELCSYRYYTPQGALTSPKLSNIIVAMTFGPVLKEYCDRKGYTLTIYADDITISMDEDLIKEHGIGAAKEIVSFASNVVESFKFHLNKKKTKFMRPSQRQYVCGVVVNRMRNLQKTERRTLRAMIHNIGINGLEAEAAKSGLSAEAFKLKIVGRLNWFGQLNSTAGARSFNLLRQALMNESIGFS